MPVLTKINTNVIADNAVTAAKIPAGAVDSDIGVGSVTASHIAANAVGSSEIADDAVLPANIAYLGDGSGNLSGTLTGEQLRFGTAFTLTDDLTVNGDVTLGKVGDDSTGQSLTQDSSANRTLTGTGTLRMGSSLSSVDGMTGTIGRGVNIQRGSYIQCVISEGTSPLTGGATTLMTLQEVTDNIFYPNSGDFTVNATDITIPTTGIYQISFMVNFVDPDDDDDIRMRIHYTTDSSAVSNSSDQLAYGFAQIYSPAGSGRQSVGMHNIILSLSAGWRVGISLNPVTSTLSYWA